MKLALVRQRYNAFGGAERFLQRALTSMGKSGIAMTVLAREWEDAPGIDVVLCNPFYLGRLWRDWSFARAVCGELTRRDFDIVQSHERIACCDIYRAGDGVHAQWLRNRGRAVGCARRIATRLNPYHVYTLAAERRLFASPRLNAVICNSHMVADEIERWFAVAPGKLHVIHNGVDLEHFHPRLREEHRLKMRAQLGIAGDAIVFLFVGGGFFRKGVPQLLEAFARLGDGGTRLVIVGDDRDSTAMQAKAARLAVAGRVTFAGSQHDVRPWYGMADCFVLPTLYDPFPNAALEAMACGLPVITSTSCGAAEAIVEADNGYVCDALDIAALADRMRCVRTDTAGQLGRRARECALRFDHRETAAKLVDLYRRLLAE